MRSNVDLSVTNSVSGAKAAQTHEALGTESNNVRSNFAAPELETPQTRMLLALNAKGKPMYQGTVPAAVKAKRRAGNKAARKARRV